MGKLTSSKNRIIAGVCAGIAENIGWNIALTRLLFLTFTILTAGAGVIAYFFLAVNMRSDRNSGKNYAERINNRLGK